MYSQEADVYRHHRYQGLTDKTASSLALSVSVTRSVAPLNSMSRGLSTFSAMTCSIDTAILLKASLCFEAGAKLRAVPSYSLLRRLLRLSPPPPGAAPRVLAVLRLLRPRSGLSVRPSHAEPIPMMALRVTDALL